MSIKLPFFIASTGFSDGIMVDSALIGEIDGCSIGLCCATGAVRAALKACSKISLPRPTCGLVAGFEKLPLIVFMPNH